MRILTLLIQCPDQPGIVAAISNLILQHQGNIICSDQHTTDPRQGQFFMRLVFSIEAASYDQQALAKNLRQFAQTYSAEWQLYDDHY